MATFVGVDLAWKSNKNPTGAAVLSGDRSGVELLAVSPPLLSLVQVVEFIEKHCVEETVVAIDAPLVIANASGQRPCETLIGRRYGARDAACHTSNLSLYPEASSVALARALAELGFSHPESGVQPSQRTIVEVYPHAGMVALFDLPKIIKYKKGSLSTKRAGLGRLREQFGHLGQGKPRVLLTPNLSALLSHDMNGLPGLLLKHYEDTLDAFFCAYLAYYFWYWGWDRNELFGNARVGYVVNPTLCAGQT